MTILQFASGQASFADDQSMWNPDELCIGKLDAGTSIPVIQQNIETAFL